MDRILFMWYRVTLSFCLFTSNTNLLNCCLHTVLKRVWIPAVLRLFGNHCKICCSVVLGKGQSRRFQQSSCSVSQFPAYIGFHAACKGLLCFQPSSPFTMSLSPFYWAFSAAECKLWLAKLLKSLLGKSSSGNLVHTNRRFHSSIGYIVFPHEECFKLTAALFC